MDDDDIEALRGAPTGELSDEFRDGLWSAIAGKLANGRRTQPNTARRRGVAT
ncbi:MAG: hypothetical protein JWR83_432, partial [Aeromicrobium sp.]|nr:hypothetical protein [Aeromicrobium sp.]